MNCIVTAGPTCEPLDRVRRLTNFSTGRLGSELANFLAGQGHHVILCKSSSSTFRGELRCQEVLEFTTTADLAARLESLANRPIDALFHAAAVSDFGFGKVWQRRSTGELVEVQSGKFSSRDAGLLVELSATAKVIRRLRTWFQKAWIVGWKYEVDGARETVLGLANAQILENQTDACVANGPAYGQGFGYVTKGGLCAHQKDSATLFQTLARSLDRPRP